MTAAQKAQLAARMSSRTRVSPAVKAPPTQNQVLGLLALLKYLQSQSRPPTADGPAAMATIPLDQGAVVNYVGQAVQDQFTLGVADQALDFVKNNVETAALGALGIGGGVAGIGAGLETTLASLSAAAPVGAVATTIAGLAIGLFDAFGGDFSLQGYATTPQLDASTALGRAAGMKQAKLIKQDLLDTGYKFARKTGFQNLDVLGG